MSLFKSWKLSLLAIATFLRYNDAAQMQHQRPVYNPLNGQHLRIVWPRWKGNPKEMTGPLKGEVILDYLSARFNFSYEMVPVTERRWDPEPTRGLLSYLLENKSDLLLDALPPTSRRLELFDLTLPWTYDSMHLLIPAPNQASANIDAVIKPFQWPVWLSVGVSLASVIMVLSQLPRLLSRFRGTLNINSDENDNWCADNRRVIKSFDSYLYVFGNLLSQGGPCKIKKIQFRVVAGVWTLAAFVLVQAYTSTLITYLVVPNNSPLINSIQDVVQRNDINLLLRKESLIDEYLNSNQTTLIRKLKERADSFPKSRCILTSECVRLISPESRNTFANAKVYHFDTIIDNFKKTGKCNFQLVQDTIMNFNVVFALPKSSPFTNIITRGVLELQENGLTNYWDTWFRQMPSQCLENVGNGHKAKTSKPSSLSLKNLAGAFIVLVVGISLSFASFLYEKILQGTYLPHPHD